MAGRSGPPSPAAGVADPGASAAASGGVPPGPSDRAGSPASRPVPCPGPPPPTHSHAGANSPPPTAAHHLPGPALLVRREHGDGVALIGGELIAQSDRKSKRLNS